MEKIMTESSRIQGHHMQSPRRNKLQPETLKIKCSQNTNKPFRKTQKGKISFQELPLETNWQRQEGHFKKNLNTSSLPRPGGGKPNSCMCGQFYGFRDILIFHMQATGFKLAFHYLCHWYQRKQKYSYVWRTRGVIINTLASSFFFLIEVLFTGGVVVFFQLCDKHLSARFSAAKHWQRVSSLPTLIPWAVDGHL